MQKLKKVIVTLTALLFASYSAYNIFIAVRDGKRGLSPQAILISVVVALLYAVFTGFMITVGNNTKDIRFLIGRRVAFIIALLAVFALKLRMVGQVLAYLDFNKLYTVLYGCAYLTTQIGLLLLLAYYIFILKRLPLYPRASVALPLIAAILFLCSLVIEAVLFFAYGIGLEANALRTIVMRPVFYFGLIGLSLYFLFPTPTTNPSPAQRSLS